MSAPPKGTRQTPPTQQPSTGATKGKGKQLQQQPQQQPPQRDEEAREGDEDTQRVAASGDASMRDADADRDDQTIDSDEDEDRDVDDSSDEDSDDEEEPEQKVTTTTKKKKKKTIDRGELAFAKELFKLIAKGSRRRRKASTDSEYAEEPKPPREVKFSDALMPKQLNREESLKPGRVAEWLYEVNRWFNHARVSEEDISERIRHLPLTWDKEMNEWWELRHPGLCKEGKAPKNWGDFQRIMEMSFIKRTAGEEAYAAYRQFSHAKSGESVEQYLTKKREHYNLVLKLKYIRVASPEHLILDLIEGFDGSRYPRTKNMMRGWVVKQHDAKCEMDPVDLVENTLRWAADEEPERENRQSRSHPFGNEKRRVNAVGRPEEEHEANTAQEEMLQKLTDRLVAAVGVSSSAAPLGKCRKCGQTGHSSYKCTSKTELRVCYECNKPGHIRPFCPELKRASSSGAKPKN